MIQPAMEVGVIGLGLMGRAIAARLITEAASCRPAADTEAASCRPAADQAAFAVIGYDLEEKARTDAASLGVNVQVDARSVAIKARVIILSLFSSDNRRALLWGAQSLADALRPGTVILDTTTGRPEDIEEDSRRLATAGIKLVDVCLSGSSQVMAEGRAIALVGDRKENADYREVIEALSKAQYYFQTPGQGNRVKLIVNLVFGLNRLVLAEALGLAERAGFNLNAILEILKSGETYSVAMDTKGPKMIAGVYEPAVARLGQHAKDVHLILDYARQLGASVAVTETHAQIIDALVREGLGDLDNAAIFKAYHS